METTLQYSSNMSQPLDFNTYTPRQKTIKWLHVIMISLCVLATYVLYSHPSTGVKLVISLLLIAYTATIVFNSKAIKLIFKIGQSQEEESYCSLHKWKIDEDKDLKNKEQTASMNVNTVNSSWKQNQNESALNVSHSKSQRSQDIKNMSMSIYRSLSVSGLSESRISRIKSSGIKKQLKGFDLVDAFAMSNSKDLDASSIKTHSSGLVLVDSNTYLSNSTQKFLQQAEGEYQKTLRLRLKKDRKYMSSRYQSILNYIRNLIKSYVNEHKFACEKLRDLSKQFFDVIIQESNKKADYQSIAKKGTLQSKVPFNVLIYRLILLKEGKIQFAEAGLPLKMEKRWSAAQSRLDQCLRNMIKLSEVLGVDSSLIKSRFRDNTKQFIEDYFDAVEMVENYLKSQSKDKNNRAEEMLNSTMLCYMSNCRTFILYLVIQQLNSSLKYSGKIKFQDNLNLRYPTFDKVDILVAKKIGSEDPLLHFDVKVLEEGLTKETLSCQPGQRNYLSVLYCLLFQFSSKSDLLSWNMQIKQLVNEIL